MSELQAFVEELSKKLDGNSVSEIEQTLKVNSFITRLQIKLISDKDLGMMFQSSAIAMGAKNLLSYLIQLLRDESPLVVKSRKKSSASATAYANVDTNITKENSILLLGNDDCDSDDSDTYDRVDKQPKSKGVSTSLLSCFASSIMALYLVITNIFMYGKICFGVKHSKIYKNNPAIFV